MTEGSFSTSPCPTDFCRNGAKSLMKTSFWWNRSITLELFKKDITLSPVFQVDSTRVHSRIHLESSCILFGGEHSQIGMNNLPGFHQDSRWTPDEPNGVSGVHLQDSSVNYTWTQLLEFTTLHWCIPMNTMSVVNSYLERIT